MIERPTGGQASAWSGRPRTPCRPSPDDDVGESNGAHVADG